MKIILRDGTEVETTLGAEFLYCLCKAVHSGFAKCTVTVKYGTSTISLNVGHINVDKTFEGYIIDSFRDTEPP